MNNNNNRLLNEEKDKYLKYKTWKQNKQYSKRHNIPTLNNNKKQSQL